ncbi:bifunctional riboflavin kinase/FAD synthetase [Oscillospiraceae bacterium OttesenSCG-928-G22]|nr:bifunctional riboflavin kinase/FAD synthetase [Oscillospiraceae bacterium OttesenSCG-928-G22]
MMPLPLTNDLHSKKKRVIALGFFDGIHLGHAALLRRVRDIAEERDLIPSVATFISHPIDEITGHHLLLLNTPFDRAGLMRRLYGIDDVILTPFSTALMNMPWERYLNDIVIGEYGAAHIVAGYNYHFGHRGEGNPVRLAEAGERLGVPVDIMDKVEIDGIKISSTYIRKLIAQGDIERANRFLGHPHVLSGEIGHGHGRGRTMGVPTINMPLPTELQEPRKGVYLTRVFFDGEVKNGLTNIGTRPTFTEGDRLSVETTILDFSGDMYGKFVRLEFYKFLRPERKFSSAEELKAQIASDIAEARRYFSSAFPSS